MDNNIKIDEFEALIKITVELSKYLYPYIREILQSKEDPENMSSFFRGNGSSIIFFKLDSIE